MYEELLDWLRNDGCSNDTDCEHCPDSTQCTLFVMNRAADAIEELQKQKWIPVTEQLPKIGKKVLVFSYGNDVLTARMCKQTENDYPVFECNSIYLEMAKPGRITHWMPLPEPPKEYTDETT